METERLTKEDKSKILTRPGYDLDADIADDTLSGIEEHCVFHKVQHFHPK